MANRVFPYLKTAAPTVNDDTGDGYKVGDEWLDTTNDIMYKVIDVTAGAAIWVELVGRTQTQTLTNKTLTSPIITGYSKFEGLLINGKISVTVASNNITVALKTWAGSDPSASDPVRVYINGNERTVTSALSVTVNAGANSFNAGGAELATKEIDYFAYLSYRAASSAIVIGFARIPYARLYSDFSATATAEKYGAFSTAPAATDDVVNIGRFAATLSAGAGYTWTVPTFTGANLVQRPTYETRWLSWTPAASASGSLTWTSVSFAFANYMVLGKNVYFKERASGTLGGTAAAELRFTLPFEVAFTTGAILAPAQWADNGGSGFGGIAVGSGTPDYARGLKYNDGNWTNTGTGVLQSSGWYEIE